ncbi:flavohemoglobin expression-modulating QEGLA motif protein [Sulfuriflexus sp.]|uniref:flavohemoglobin expression-modulating QEGLA motif protein n=1 Tax=Sulfuriflexus sp. TaxID=2015443 RepID=UPI0028CED208|nr:tyrosine/phenylalanine carboxypeptidase domain-containing protein [Sulfuriflexus sp.]MDT8405463.1 DUF1704 domain-containing protein [Sulfuriflexus sp.]
MSNGDEDYLNDALIDSVLDKYRRNIAVRTKMNRRGRIHLDRQLPFLAFYRQPSTANDRGTARLLLGETSFLLADNQPGHQAALHRLVTGILDIQHRQFGACLLLELWAGTEVTDETRHVALRIIAPPHNVPPAFLERMENAMLNIRINDHQRAAVAVSYQEEPISPSPPLLSDRELKQFNCLHIGLEVSPIYRDTGSNQLLPFLLRRFHHAFSRALKRSFYAFTHYCTHVRPVHYLELGQRSMTPAVYETDERLARISNDFDLLLHVTPTNAPFAWEEFSCSSYARIPEFLYRPRTLDPALVKRELFAIPIERIEDPTLAHIFSQKRDELDRQLTLIADRNTPRFLLGSRQLFGDVDAGLLSLAEQILVFSKTEAVAKEALEYLSAEAFAEQARQEIAYYRQQDAGLPARVEVRQDVTGIMVSKGNFLVGMDAQVSSAGLRATLAHEIGTHVLTHYNGNQQPFRELYAGMAGYESMQEGLAVLAEYLVGGLGRTRLRLLASRVMAVHMITEGADFIETFRGLRERYDLGPRAAFYISMRVFRGGGYTKDKIYLQGLKQLLHYLAKGGDLEDLYLGKVSYDYLPLVRELQWRRILVRPRLLPRFLAEKETTARLDILRKGLTVMDLMKDAS